MASTGQFIAVFNTLTIAVIVAGLIFLLALAAVVRDTEFITKHPIMFIIETIAMFVFPGLPILMFMLTQDVKVTVAFKFFISIGIKFAIFHVLFHLAGMYRILFEIDNPSPY